MDYCLECGFQSEDTFRTVYGEVLCEECWEDYLCSKRGKVEYFVGICVGTFEPDDFDADYLGLMVQAYLEYKEELDLEPHQLLELEDKARELGLL
jgi:hypothetical protein